MSLSEMSSCFSCFVRFCPTREEASVPLNCDPAASSNHKLVRRSACVKALTMCAGWHKWRRQES
eukprot:4383339-Amphidinium_carterae.1